MSESANSDYHYRDKLVKYSLHVKDHSHHIRCGYTQLLKSLCIPKPKGYLGEASPRPPRGRWEKNFPVEFLTETPAFVAAQKCHGFAFWQNHTTTPLGVVGRGFQPRLLEVDYARAITRARDGELKHRYIKYFKRQKR